MQNATAVDSPKHSVVMESGQGFTFWFPAVRGEHGRLDM